MDKSQIELMKPPARASQLRWVWWLDHSDHMRKDKADAVSKLEVNVSIGWLHLESDDVSEEAYCVCSTGEIDVLKLSKRDIIKIEPLRKPRKRKVIKEQ